MKKYRLAIFGLAVTLLAAAQLVGCAAPLEKKFEPVPSVPEGKALVYIYRLAKQNDTGLKYYLVKANGVNVVRMYAGGYFPYFCRPGRVQFTATLVTDIEAGRTYYLKLYVAEGTRVGTPALELVAPETGILELSQCKLIAEKKEAGF